LPVVIPLLIWTWLHLFKTHLYLNHVEAKTTANNIGLFIMGPQDKNSTPYQTQAEQANAVILGDGFKEVNKK
jgi:hypothetical protein